MERLSNLTLDWWCDESCLVCLHVLKDKVGQHLQPNTKTNLEDAWPRQHLELGQGNTMSSGILTAACDGRMMLLAAVCAFCARFEFSDVSNTIVSSFFASTCRHAQAEGAKLCSRTRERCTMHFRPAYRFCNYRLNFGGIVRGAVDAVD